MEQKLMITSLPQAFKMIKEMNLSTDWDIDCTLIEPDEVREELAGLPKKPRRSSE